MPRLRNVADLLQASDAARREIESVRDAGTTIYIGMGTCGIAAGARDTLAAVEEELVRLSIAARIEAVGCIGYCVKEPLVDIQQAGGPRVTYANVSPDRVPRIIEEHLVKGKPVKQWVVGKLED